jgi:hypothetical protein
MEKTRQAWLTLLMAIGLHRCLFQVEEEHLWEASGLEEK